MKTPPTLDETRTLRELDAAHLWHPYTQMADYVQAGDAPIIERGAGVYVFDTEGRRYLDGYSQMWCTVWGHAHPELNRAIAEQLERIAHASLFSASNVPAIELAARLAAIASREFASKGAAADSALPRVFLSDNGSTAVEIALKMAVQYHGNEGDRRRTRLLCFGDAYHGDTAATLTLGGVELFRRAYRPLTFDVLRAPYPMRRNGFQPESAAERDEYQRAIVELETTFAHYGAELAAAVIEPGCQGAGGIRPLYPGFLRRLRELCDDHGVLLIADEVLTAFGRCGAYFACAEEGVTPDFLCLAKGLTGGYLPLAATLASERVYRAFLGRREDFKHFFHGHTFTGNPLGCAAALASLDLIEREGLIARIRELQPLMIRRLEALARLPQVAEVRHRGMMAGVVLRDPTARGTEDTGNPIGPDGEYASPIGQSVARRALELGTIIRPLGNVIALMPIPATAAAELEELFAAVETAIRTA